MAVDAKYAIVTQYPDVETDGGQYARDVMVVGILTDGHSVYFEQRYPRKGFTVDETKNNAGGYTLVFEQLFTIPNVDSVVWGQALNAANQLEDQVTVYYLSDSGDSSNYVVVPFRQLTQGHVETLVAAGVEQLNANEG